MSEKLGWGSIILFKWNKEWERAAFTSHNRWKNQPRFPSLAPFNRRRERQSMNQSRRELKFSIERTISALFVSRRKASPSASPDPSSDPLAFCIVNGERGGGEKKKRSFCNQDTVHRTCERSRIDHCSWHARFVIAIRHREIELAFEILQAAN